MLRLPGRVCGWGLWPRRCTAQAGSLPRGGREAPGSATLREQRSRWWGGKGRAFGARFREERVHVFEFKHVFPRRLSLPRGCSLASRLEQENGA